mmetsp:Transcript_6441/g.10682  ORF Transcript_6441/g.10682 Transcript_6441/m.10682 type:complete len:215 (-) Transcript_6441:192-836(-)
MVTPGVPLTMMVNGLSVTSLVMELVLHGVTHAPDTTILSPSVLLTLVELVTVANHLTLLPPLSTLLSNQALSMSQSTRDNQESRTFSFSSLSDPFQSSSLPSHICCLASTSHRDNKSPITLRVTRKKVNLTKTRVMTMDLVKFLSTRPLRLLSSFLVWFPTLLPTSVSGLCPLLTPNLLPFSGRRPCFPPLTSTGSLLTLVLVSLPVSPLVSCL